MSGHSDSELECLVCIGALDVAEAPPQIAELCDDHRAAALDAQAIACLKTVIPEKFHTARPSTAHRSLEQWQPWHGGLYLYGDVGTGKSHDAAAMLKRAYMAWRRDRHRTPMTAWVNVPSLFDLIVEGYGDKSVKIDMSWRDADMLVLDDIGMGDNRPHAVRKLYAVIERRMQHELVTIITSNRDLEELADHMDGRQIASRISEMCAQVSYKGLPDRRPELGPQISARN